MARGEPPEPLWAGSLADQPRPADDVIVRLLAEEPEEEVAAPVAERRPRGRRPLVAAAVVAVAALVIALDGRGALLVEEVPSYWGSVPMRCDTVRLEQDARAVELFRCRALGGAPLPTGVYRSPRSQWTSDITGRDARASRIRISPDGDVAGWARY